MLALFTLVNQHQIYLYLFGHGRVVKVLLSKLRALYQIGNRLVLGGKCCKIGCSEYNLMPKCHFSALFSMIPTTLSPETYFKLRMAFQTRTPNYKHTSMLLTLLLHYSKAKFKSVTLEWIGIAEL